MKPVRYPRIRTDYEGRHLAVEVTYAEGESATIGCGESWCDGRCGLPAIVIPAAGGCSELKMHSGMVAIGPVMAPFRVEWKGGRIEVPEAHREDFRKRMWW